MKTLLLFATLFIYFQSFAASIEIQDAIKNKQVKVVTEYKNLEKDGMLLTISNLQNNAISIAIPSGTVFLPENESEQPLLNIQNEEILVKGNESKTVEVGAYCMDYSKLAPNYTTNFKIEKTKDNQLLSFLDFIKTQNPSEDNYQSALWVLCNKKSIAHINVYTDKDTQLREYLAKQTEQENPWYETTNEILAEAGQNIEVNSFSIEGKLEIKTEKDTDFEIVVIDVSDNTIKHQFQQGGSFKKGWDNTLGFSLKVTSWPKGEYEVLVRNPRDKVKIADFPFEI